MSKVLCTFSGKFGDILWSLPTVKAISKKHDCEVDFAIMPQYESLLPLLNEQSYIDEAYVISNWECTGSPYGDQPWQPPERLEPEGGVSYHLTYRNHPSMIQPLVDFIASQQGIKLVNPIPFLSTILHFANRTSPFIGSFAFNSDYDEFKKAFWKIVMSESGMVWYNLAELPWEKAVYSAYNSLCYIGDRSANWVIANGVGQKNIFTYEPHPNRNMYGQYGQTFGNPYWKEYSVPVNRTPEQAAEACLKYIRMWKEEKEKEILNESH